MLHQPRISRIFHYISALIITACVASVLYGLQSVLDTSLIVLLFLLPVSLITGAWGLGPGITSAVASFLIINYLFIEPRLTLFVHQTQDLIVLFMFLATAVVISQLVSQAQRGRALATEREHDAMHLYELSAELAGLYDYRDICMALSKRIQETFQALTVQVVLDLDGQSISYLHRAPVIQPGASLPVPDLLVPMQSPGKLLGEIRLWLGDQKLSHERERLVHTFAYQGISALERARLVKTETLARVLEESDRLKSSLLSSVSHELRTPLATIKAAVTGLRSDDIEWDTEISADLLDIINEETDHLNLLVGNLLDMSRIEAGALKPERQWYVLSELVSQVLKRMRPALKDHRITVKIPDDFPLVPVDGVQIEQVLTNLIDNSLKYSPPDSLIQLEAWQTTGNLFQVKVSNEGPPVTDVDLTRIFDKFQRVTAADRITGTGLGLSICKGIIQAHGGSIWAENLQKGFAIHFTLPLAWQGPAPRIPEE